MKICIFSIVTYWHGIRGGMEIHGKLLSDGLVKRGHSLTIISTRHPEGMEFEERNGVKILYLKNTVFGSQRNGWGRESFKKFLDLDKNDHFDLICCQQAIIPSRLFRYVNKRKIVAVIFMHGHHGRSLFSEFRQTFSHKKEFYRLIRQVMSFLYYHLLWEQPSLRKFNTIITVSNNVASSVQRWFLINDKKIYTICNGVDINSFRPSNTQKIEVRRAYNIGSDERVLLFLSFLTKQKGLHLLLNAFSFVCKKIDKLRLMIVGEGDYLKEAKELIKKLGIERNVVFVGYIPHQQIPQYINSSDIFVFPTIRQEGLPFVLIEVMSCQKPIIASRIGGIPSVIKDGEDGILAPPGDVNILADKIIYLLENEHIAHEMALRARKKIVKQFSSKKMTEDTIRVFEMAVAKTKK